MNIQQTLNSMLKQHKEISKNLNTLEDLQMKCKTVLGNDKDKKNFNKLLKQTKKTYFVLNNSYKMIARDKTTKPKEFLEIGIEIEEMGKTLESFKEF